MAFLCAACAGACTMPMSGILDRNAGIAPISLTVDSVPSGAEARTRDGASCVTPCELTITPMGPFKVEFMLKGYEPQSAEVVLAALNPNDLSAGIRLDPNPLMVELTALPRAPASAKLKPVARPPKWPDAAASYAPRNP
jgi:PEGA domain